MKGNQGFKQGRPQPRPRKECRFKVPKTSPFEMATCNTKIGKDGNISRVHCQNLEGAKVQLFEAKKKKVYYFYSYFQKLHLCTLNFLYLLFLQIKAIKLPAPPLTRIQQKFAKIIRGLSKGANYKCQSFTSFVFTQKPALSSLFWGQGGMLGCPLQPVPAWECKRWRF